MPKVSVVIPIYGVEKYIERCARSLFEQTLDDMEFVFVDDCTKDESIHILENVIKDYPVRQPYIHIVHHKKNRGLSRARETGVKAATGDFIAHCDSDDWVDRKMYETLYTYAVNEKSDFVKSGYYIADGLSNTPVGVFSEGQNFAHDKVVGYLLRQTGWNTVWNILVKKELYSYIVFTDDMMMEDQYIVSQLLIKSNNIGVVDIPLYYYYSNQSSMCHLSDTNSVIRKAHEAERNAFAIVGYIKNEYGNKFDDLIPSLLIFPRLSLIPIMDKYSNYSIWSTVTPHITSQILISPYINFKVKLWYLSVELRFYPLFKFIKESVSKVSGLNK